ncbi:MAG TPA: TlpA family protein disulfide reductase [Acidobacteria bacterium]|nr:TlpA family protein disulfide reductase [Acidobacteriota bacterium]
MSDLPGPGAKAPTFSLTTPAGAPVVFRDEPVASTLLVFFKHDCDTCHLTLPLVERLQNTLSPAGLRVVGISQDGTDDTARVVTRHSLTFTVALDDHLEVSADYGFDAVPALVLTGPDRAILASFEGFTRPDLRNLTEAAATACDTKPPHLVHDGDGLPEHRPGCGSKVHDPDVARRLAVRRGASTLGARRSTLDARRSCEIPDGSRSRSTTTRSSSCRRRASTTVYRWCRPPRHGCSACSKARGALPRTSWPTSHPISHRPPSRK